LVLESYTETSEPQLPAKFRRPSSHRRDAKKCWSFGFEPLPKFVQR
jgi:hypothetical protein